MYRKITIFVFFTFIEGYLQKAIDSGDITLEEAERLGRE